MLTAQKMRLLLHPQKNKAYAGAGGLRSIAKHREREESLNKNKKNKNKKKKQNGHIDESAKISPKLPFLSPVWITKACMSSRNSGLCPGRKDKTRVLRRTATGRHRHLHILQQTAYILSPLWTSTGTITMIVWHAARCIQWADGVVDSGSCLHR